MRKLQHGPDKNVPLPWKTDLEGIVTLKVICSISEWHMKPWDIVTWNFPDAGEHPAVILGTNERVRLKPTLNVLLCSSQRANRAPKLTEVILDQADGLDWPTLCKCDLVYAVPVSELFASRGTVSYERRREIADRVIRGLGLAGF